MKNKIMEFIIGTLCYFIIVFFLFWLLKRLGMFRDTSDVSLAVGVTIGWLLVQGMKSLKKHNK